MGNGIVRFRHQDGVYEVLPAKRTVGEFRTFSVQQIKNSAFERAVPY